jgi:hypothetical protein
MDGWTDGGLDGRGGGAVLSVYGRVRGRVPAVLLLCLELELGLGTRGLELALALALALALETGRPTVSSHDDDSDGREHNNDNII